MLDLIILGTKNLKPYLCYILKTLILWIKLKKIRKKTNVVKVKDKNLKKSLFLLLKSA